MEHEFENSRVYLMDCMEGMSKYPDNHFELAVVDPPYGINVGRQRINSDRKTPKWSNPIKYDYKTFDDSTPPPVEYWDELFRVSKNQIVFGGNYFTEILYPSKGWIVWDKQVDIKEHLSMCELAWTSFDIKCNKFEYLWAGFKKKKQVKRIHPTQKPVALYDWIFKNYAKEGDKILDTHLGSQSSRISAYKNGLDFTGYELDADYFRDGNKRFTDFTNQLVLI